MLDPKALLAYCESELDALVHCLRQAVEIESPSQNKAAIDRMANFFAQEFSQRGAKVQLLSHADGGFGRGGGVLGRGGGYEAHPAAGPHGHGLGNRHAWRRCRTR